MEEPLSKGIVLRSMYDGVRDARVKATEFIDTVAEFLSLENDNQVVDIAYNYLGAATAILPKSKSPEYLSKLYRVSRAKLLAAEDKQFIISLTQKLVSYCFACEDVIDIKAMAEGTGDLAKFELTNEQKWQVTCMVAACPCFSEE